MRNEDIKIVTSKRFLKNYRKCSPKLQNLVEGAVHEFVRSYRSDHKTVIHQYDRVEALRNESALEIDVSGKDRLIAQFANDELVLLNVGGHDVIPRYTTNKLRGDLNSTTTAPQQFWPESKSKFFLSLPDRSSSLLSETEISEDWLYFLDDQQEEVLIDIFDEINDSEGLGSYVNPFVIVGGPGTGKTCILLNLLKWFSDEGYDVGISLSDELFEFLAYQFPEIGSFRSSLTDPFFPDILLLDDPNTIDIENLYGNPLNNTATIVAFDPLQLEKSITDNEFKKLIGEDSYYILRNCYRQRENIGKQTKHIIDMVAKSTPFLNKAKINNYNAERTRVTSLANDLNFVHTNGYIETYTNYSIKNLRTEITRIEGSWDKWTHAPGLLIITFNQKITEQEQGLLSSLLGSSYATILEIVNLDELISIKGLEYQHILMFIDKELFDYINNGFDGSGRRVYNQRKLMRIPFSRAKDSVVTFVVEK